MGTQQQQHIEKGDLCKFNRSISSTDRAFLKNDSLDNACENFTSLFITRANECIPCKEVTIKPNDKPWYDSEIRTASRKCDRLRNNLKAVKSGSTQDCQSYKKLQIKLKILKIMQKDNFILILSRLLLKRRIPIQNNIGNLLNIL